MLCIERPSRFHSLHSHFAKTLQVIKGMVPQARQILLIAKKGLIPLYEGAGFTLRGESAVVHGQDPWYELALSLTD